MLKLLVSLVGLLQRSHTELLAENLALRHQSSVLQPTARRPRLKARDRVFLGPARSHLAGLATSPRHRQARDGHHLAPPGLSPLLALQVASQPAGTVVREGRDPGTDPTNLAGGPALGFTQDL